MKSVSGLLAATAVAPSVFAEPAYFKRPGIQLFTVMTLLDKDFDGTLQKVSDIGYRSVETVGAFGMPAEEVHEKLTQYGFTSPSQHLMPGDLYSYFSAYNRGEISWDNIVKKFTQAFDFDRVEEFVTEAIGRAQALGQQYIVWQLNWVPEYGVEEVKKHIKAFTTAGKLCKDAGLGFAFHNHNHEFAPLKGSTAYDMMVQETDPDLVMLEMDFMWASYAGVDPVSYFHKYPDRYRMVHLKDHTKEGKIVIPGQGVENFQRLLAASEAAGIEHAFVEFDQPVDPMKEIAAAYKYLTNVPKN